MDEGTSWSGNERNNLFLNLGSSTGSTYNDSGTFDAENLLDGETERGNRDSHLGTHWIPLEGTFTETVTFDLGAAYDLAQLKILNTSNSG